MLPERTLDIYLNFFEGLPASRPRPDTLRTAAHAWARTRLEAACAAYGLGTLPPVQTGAHGKPSFGDDFPLHFNLSHSGAGAALAISDAPVGIDLEGNDGHRWAELSQRFFSPGERAVLNAQPLAARPETFILLWTCKESLYKYIGCGLSRGLSRYTLQFDGADIKKVRASYEARTLYFSSRQVAHGNRMYRLTVCSPWQTDVYFNSASSVS
ncbi:MAG: 4'-phosphopantetheinyl transferase superfamily protein [Bacteroidales bacterium]|nr:4'-phosphopantetheinyl transferase superfamily protein [Bacteroidales bacterium]